MTVDTARVKARLCLYAGEDPGDDPARDGLFTALAQDAAQRGQRLLRGRGESPETLSAAENWCAAGAFLELTLLDAAAGPEKLSADGISVELSGRTQRARELLSEKYRALTEALGEEGFYFGRA